MSGSCAIGCTDSLAANYDATALVDDGSCMYPCTDNSVYIAVVTDYYGTECSWDITDASGAVVAFFNPDALTILVTLLVLLTDVIHLICMMVTVMVGQLVN